MKLLSNQALLIDERSKSLSVTITTTVADYLTFIKKAYEADGGLEGQRAPLKTKTAISIRSRMISDLLSGTVLPPIVIGVVPKDEAQMKEFQDLAGASKLAELAERLGGVAGDSLAIIDGMQRTTALLEALNKAPEAMRDRPVRLELWVALKANSLIYRMLVLNTGQVPWDVRRQLETVYAFLLREIRTRVPNVSVFKLEDKNRRSSSGQYQSSMIIESYFAFTTRKPIVDVKERVAEDFARLDATASASESKNFDRFVETLRLLAELDGAFSRYVNQKDEVEPDQRFTDGKDIFALRAAIAGFVSAAAVSIFGEPGFDKDPSEIAASTDALTQSISGLTAKLNAMSPAQVGEFLELDVLRQRLVREKSGGVGDFEREVFHRAFLSAIKHGDKLTNMVPCWRAAWDV
jgi:hypothetical protein